MHWLNVILCLLVIVGVQLVYSFHDEYEQRGFYPQKIHSLTKPYQGIVFWDCFQI